MVPELRKKFNAEFTEEKYQNFIKELDTALKYPTDFRVSETPLFLSDEFYNELLKACDELTSQVSSSSFKRRTDEIVSAKKVNGEEEHPVFLQLDFAIYKNKEGFFKPKLIELQGFPSLYAYQSFFSRVLRKHFNIPKNLTSHFSNYDEKSYIELLKETIVGDNDPENVILLEIEPEKQKTRIDFAATEEMIGIKAVDISSIKKRDSKLFYNKNGKEIPVKRIYNRVILDEIDRKNIQYDFNFDDELDVEWCGHPNWFLKISKISLPLLKGKFVPECYFLNELDKYPDDLSKFVLKPLFSFAGLGVEVDLNKQMLDKITDKKKYIIQGKIKYAPLIETPDKPSKVEIRMMFLWPKNKKPIPVNNLIRMSKGKMMGVDFNKNKTWVGSSVAFHKVFK
jgi:ABC-type transporter MlaC component